MVLRSSSWTGPPEMSVPGRAFTHRCGAPSATADYFRIAEIERVRAQVPPQLRPVIAWASLLLLAQLSSWVGTLVLDAASNDWRVAGRSDDLILWSVAMCSLALWQIGSRSLRLVVLRRASLILAIATTIVVAMGNVYFGIRSHAQAAASLPERTFVLLSTRGRGPSRTTVASFQRADGSFVDGREATAPSAYARICASVQRLDGPDGYSWVHVREWSRSPRRGELARPIRREECFSNIPLSTLPR